MDIHGNVFRTENQNIKMITDGSCETDSYHNQTVWTLVYMSHAIIASSESFCPRGVIHSHSQFNHNKPAQLWTSP